MQKISVVIPSYNAGKTIRRCITSVLENDYENFEVIVVDDESKDNTKKIIREMEDNRLKLIQNKINSGASFSRNKGIKNSTGGIIVLLDSDSYVPKDWIKKHLELHNKIQADIIGGGIIGIHNTLWGNADSFCNWWAAIPYSKSNYLKRLHLPTNNLSIKKHVFSKIGYFDEELRLGGEDAEFCFRALKNNLRIYFQSNLIIYHFDRNDFKDFIKHQETWGKHAVKMRKKHKMNYSFLMPPNYFLAHLYVIPLALLFTCFIIKRWIWYKPSVILYFPLIFLGKIKQTIVIKDSLKNQKS